MESSNESATEPFPMTPHTLPTQFKSPVDPPSSWLELMERMRRRLEGLRRNAVGTPLEEETVLLARDAKKLCAHVEQLHREAHRWLSQTSSLTDDNGDSSSDIPAVEVERAAVSIHREQHEQSANPLQVIKALLMWVDTPEERVRDGDSTEIPV